MVVRRYGRPPPAGRRHRLRPGVYAVIRLGAHLGGGVLLTLQADGREPAELQLPGGGVDPGEQPLAALHREVLEETGWRLAAPRRIGAFRLFGAVPAAAFEGGGSFGRMEMEMGGAEAEPLGPGVLLGRERLGARLRGRAGLRDAPPGDDPGHDAEDGRVWAEKLCVVYAARAARRLGPPTEPGHAAVALSEADARLALTSEGQRALLDRALALG